MATGRQILETFETTGLKDDGQKPPVDLLPSFSLFGIARVLGFGARKYGRYNYRGGIEYMRLYGATLRHLYQWALREDFDPESGESHLLHAATNIIMLYEMTIIRPDLDDRPKI